MASLVSLPREILDDICEYLDYGFVPSIKTFALVNKRCNTVANRLIFRKMSITVTDPTQLTTDVQRLVTVLERASSFQHVRQLTVKQIPKHPKKGRTAIAHRHVEIPDVGSEDDDLSLPRRVHRFVDQFQSIVPGEELDNLFRPLVDLLRKLSQLSDLIYDALDQVPPCVLEVLHECRPQCRLHVCAFGLRSLRRGKETLRMLSTAHDDSQVDPYEWKLSSSPCLYNITLGYNPSSMVQQTSSDERTVIDHMIELLAPNVQKVRLTSDFHEGNVLAYNDDSFSLTRTDHSQFLETDVYSNVDLAVWRDAHQVRRWAIERLSLYTRDSFPFLFRSNRVWSYLTVLKIYEIGPVPSILVDHVDFPSLKTLLLKFRSIGDPESQRQMNDLMSFLQKLRPLTNLRLLQRYDEPLLATVFLYHGSQLRKLWLDGFDFVREIERVSDTLSLIQEIGRRCPQLASLRLPMRRSKGDVEEVDIYRALGALPRMQQVSLIFCCESVPEGSCIPGLRFMTPDMEKMPQPENQAISTVINYAVDEALARAIFQVMAAEKPRGSCPLDCLWLQHRPMDGSAPNSLDQLLLRFFGRGWLCMRNPRDDVGAGPIVRDLGGLKRAVNSVLNDETEKILDAVLNGASIDSYASERLPKLALQEVSAVLLKLWPVGSAKSPFQWHSFPLELSRENSRLDPETDLGREHSENSTTRWKAQRRLLSIR